MLVLSCWSKPTEIILSQFWRLEVRNLHFLWGSQRKCALTSEHFVVTDSLGLRAMSLHSLSLSIFTCSLLGFYCCSYICVNSPSSFLEGCCDSSGLAWLIQGCLYISECLFQIR